MFTVRPFRGSVSDAYDCLVVEGARKRLYEEGKCKGFRLKYSILRSKTMQKLKNCINLKYSKQVLCLMKLQFGRQQDSVERDSDRDSTSGVEDRYHRFQVCQQHSYRPALVFADLVYNNTQKTVDNSIVYEATIIFRKIHYLCHLILPLLNQ